MVLQPVTIENPQLNPRQSRMNLVHQKCLYYNSSSLDIYAHPHDLVDTQILDWICTLWKCTRNFHVSDFEVVAREWRSINSFVHGTTCQLPVS